MALAKEKSSIKTDYNCLNVTIVGHPKVGKSTFASQIGGDGEVYFAATEAGLNFLSVFKSDINCWNDFAVMSAELLSTKHNFKHLAIDVIDKLHEFAQEEICVRNKVKAIADIPYGGGYTASKKLMTNEFSKLNQKGIGLTFITHEKTKEVAKDNVKWTAAATSMSASIEELILGMSDIILFCHIDKTGARVMRTKPTKFIQAAGDRSGKLPEIMPLDAKLLLTTLKGERK